MQPHTDKSKSVELEPEDQLVTPIAIEIAGNALTERSPCFRSGELNLRYLGGGSFSVFSINDELIAKFPKNQLSQDGFDSWEKLYHNELALLPLVSRQVAPHQLPEPVEQLAGPSKSYAGPIYIYRYMTGRKLNDKSLSSSEQDALADLLGDFLSRLHSVDLEDCYQLGVAPLTPQAILNSWQTEYQQVREAVFPLLTAAETTFTEQFYEGFFSAGHIPRVALRHGDFDDSNILLPDKQAHLQVIDLEELGPGEPAGDLCIWTEGYGANFTEQMLRSYRHPVDSALLARMEFCWGRVPFIYLRMAAESGNQKFLKRGKDLLSLRMDT